MLANVSTPADLPLAALLGWLHRLLAWQIDVTREVYGVLADDAYRGLYVPDAEIDALGALPAALPAELAARRAALAQERAALADAPDDTPLRRLALRFGLPPFACDVLLLALLPDIDLSYEKIFGYVQDDVTRKRPTVSLALRLLCAAPEERMAARAAFAPDAPLLRQRLIQLYEDGQKHAPLLARFIRLDERIAAELLGQPALDPLLAPFVTLSRPTRALATMLLPADLAHRLRRAVAEHADGLALGLQGGYGSGRRALVEALCAEAGLPLLTVALHRLDTADMDAHDLARRLLREATLRGAAMLWTGADRLLAEDAPRALRLALLAALDEHRGAVFLALEQPWDARDTLRRIRYLRVELPPLSYSEREQLWRARLDGARPDEATLAALASTFRLSGGQIRDAVTMARSLAAWRDTASATLAPHDLYAACRAQSSGKLNNLAHKITTTYTWDDIVLPPDQLAMLREVCAQVRHRRTVLETWGFDRHLAMGKGVNVLVAGPSGTGKTMAAEIIAADLGMELYKVDLSSMVSKYIGETEKNLNQIFTAAGEANALLFFDEADAIFGKRSEVRDAHDRYANIEVGYLLQKMEEYDGVVILATNLRKNMDDAFIRRLHLAIDFPFPEEADRISIWRKVFPPEAPLADDVDLLFLARQFKLSGGNIRNIALLAAFMAVEEGAIITIRHIIRATKREYQKLGKLVTEADFGIHLAGMRRKT